MVNKLLSKKASRIKRSTILVSLLFLVSAQTASAATINLTPSKNTVNPKNQFNVSVVVAGQSEAFNAAEATVTLSSNLTATDLTLGNCGFSFVTTPSTDNPSFAGVLLGDSSKQCTVYTLTLVPNAAGTGTIDISDGSIKRYGDAVEILTGSDRGQYTIQNNPLANIFSTNTTTQNSPTPTTTVSSIPGTYTVKVKVMSSNNTPLTNAEVTLNPPQGSNSSPVQVVTDSDGYATFSNVPKDIYTVTATTKQGKKIASSIMNVNGKAQVLTLGMQEQKQSSQTLGVLIAAMIFVVAVLLITVFRNRLHALFFKKDNPVEQPV